MKPKLFFFNAAAAGTLLLAGLSPASAHGYAVCYSSAYLGCVQGGGSPGTCSHQAEAICKHHGHGGGGVQPLDNLDFKAKGKPSFGKANAKIKKFKRRVR